MPPTKTTAKKTTTPRKPAAKKRVEPSPVPPEAAQPQDKYAPTAWGKQSETGGLIELEVPSGQLCLVKRPGIEGLLKAGVLNDLDTLTALVDQKVIKKTAKGKPSKEPDVDMKAILENPEKLEAIMHTVDRTVCECVVKPPINMTPNDVTRRKSGVIYADMVDLVDKMFIFQYVVGGSQDLESFREQLGSAMGDLDPGQSLEGETQ